MAVQITPYGQAKMNRRDISVAAVESVVADGYMRPASLINGSDPVMIYEGDYEGRTLKVYVERGSDPPVVKTATWERE